MSKMIVLYCIDNSNYEGLLEIGEQYYCVVSYDNNNCYIPDIGNNIFYHKNRFVTFEEFRNWKIDNLFKY